MSTSGDGVQATSSSTYASHSATPLPSSPVLGGLTLDQTGPLGTPLEALGAALVEASGCATLAELARAATLTEAVAVTAGSTSAGARLAPLEPAQATKRKANHAERMPMGSTTFAAAH